MPKQELSLSVFLRSTLGKRQEKNSKYSLRAFARDLGISPGACSDYLSGHRIPGPKITKRIVDSLELNLSDKEKILNLIEKQKVLQSDNEIAHQLLDEQFSLIANREHFALLNLMKTSNFEFSTALASQRLGFTEEKIQDALQRLIHLGLVLEKEGQYAPVHRTITTTHDIPSEAIKEHHRQNITHALNSLFQDAPSLRDITTITTATNPENLERAKLFIRKFRRRLVKILESGHKTEVYQLNIQLVPVTKMKEVEKT